MTTIDEFLRRVYIDAIVGSGYTTPLSTDGLLDLEQYGWLTVEVMDSRITINWNMDFLQKRSIKELMKIYTFCKTGIVHE